MTTRHEQQDSGRTALRRYLLLGFLVLPAVLLGLAGTGPVLRLALPTINKTVAAMVDGRFAVGEVEGSLWTGLTVERLALTIDATGLEIDGRRLELAWSPLALLGGALQVDRLAAGSLSVVLPHGKTDGGRMEGAGENRLPVMPLAVRVGRLELPEVRIIDPAGKGEFAYTVEASAAVDKDLSADLSLSLLPLAGVGDRLRARLTVADGGKDLEAEIDGRIDRAGVAMAVAGLRPEEAADISLSLIGKGSFDRWQGDLAIGASDLAELSGRIGVERRGEEFAFTFTGSTGILGSLAERLPEPVRGAFTLNLAGRFDRGDNRLALSSLNLARPELLTLSATGDADLAVTRLAAGLEAELADLSGIAALAGVALRGGGRIAVANGVWTPDGGGSADIEISGRRLGFEQEDLNRLVGPEPVIAAKVEISPRLDLAIAIERFELAMAQGGGTIALRNSFKDLKVDCRLAVQPGAVPPASGVTPNGAAQLTAALDGPLARPAGRVGLTVPALAVGGERFDSLTLTSVLSWSNDPAPSLHNQLEFNFHENPCRLNIDAVLPPDGLRLAMTLNGAPLELAGQIELPGYRLPAQGVIKLSRFGAGLFGERGVPFTAGQIAATLDLAAMGEKQRIDLAAEATDLGWLEDGENLAGIDRLAVRGRIDDAFGEPVLAVDLDAAGLAAGQAAVERLTATLQGTAGRMRASVEGRGQVEQRLPMTLSASADIALAEGIRVAVDRFDSEVAGQRISLRRPLQVTRTAAGRFDATAALAIGDGRFDGRVRLVPDREFEASVDLDDLALGPWAEIFGEKELAGSLSLAATLSEQAGAAPRVDLSGTISDIKVAGSHEVPPLLLQLDGHLREGQARANLSLGRPDLRMITADGALPFSLSILRGQGGVDPDAPLAAHAELDGELGQFWTYAPLPDHLLAGRILLAADFSGSLTAPAWDGVLKVEGGRYENLQFGTLLDNIRLDGRFDRRGLRIAEISAGDGGKGRLTGKAEVKLDAASALAYHGQMTIRDLAVSRIDELQVWADIDMKVAGDAGTASIGSAVTVRRGEVDLAVALPASVPKLAVANLDPPDIRSKEQPVGAGPFGAALQVTVDIPGRLFLRGKGLESEWQGRLAITGPATAPEIVGDLRARRGQLDVLGRTFTIGDSKIAFLGGQPPEPILDIVGVYKTKELLVTASLIGPASTVKLALSSDPVMPQDEILSRVLFDKAQGKLSAMEAVQLAGAAAELSGKGGGLDVVGSFRRSLGIDVLRVDGGADGASVAAGKYLAEGVYVGTKRGTAPGSTGVEVEIELTPYLKVTSESTEADNKAGVQFKWDY